MMRKLLALEPVLSASGVQALLALAVALGFHFTPPVTAGIEAVAAAVAAIIAGAAVDKYTPALWTGLVTAVGTLLIAYGVPHVSSGTVSAANGLLVIVLGSLLRGHVTPTSSAAAPSAKPAVTGAHAKVSGMSEFMSDDGVKVSAGSTGGKVAGVTDSEGREFRPVPASKT